MIPLRLELRGFTCFRETTVVDLEPLEVDLFAIAGPTGAGKSTLLDGLTYALYGETARLGGRAAYLMSPGADEMMAQVVFRSGAETYRVTRYAERKKSGVQSQVRLERLTADGAWSQLPESEKVREANPKIASLVGLDFDGFTRAVLLPQGEFHEFLRGDAAKRRKLLSSLMGLDTVERMQKIAGELSREAEAEAQAVTTRLEEDYAGATPEHLRSLRDECSALRDRLAELTARQGELAAELQDLEALKAIWEEKLGLERTLDELSRRAPEMAVAAERLERARLARLLLPQVEGLEDVGRRLRSAESERDGARTTLARAEESLTRSRRARDAAERARASETPEIERRLVAVAEVGPLAERLAARGGRLDMASDGTEAYRESAWEAFQRLEARGPEILRVGRDLEGRRGRVAAVREAIAGLERSIREGDAALERLKTDGTRARERANEAAEVLTAAENEDRAAALRAHLATGDPCPVCGNPVGELPAHEHADLEALRAARDQAVVGVESLLETYRDRQAQLEADRARLAERRSDLSDLEAGTAQLQESFDALSRPFAEVGIEVNSGLQEDLRRRREALLGSLARKVVERTGGEDPEAVRRRLVARREELEAAQRRAGDALAAGEQELERARTSLTMLDRRCAELDRERSGLVERNRSLLREAGFASSEEVSEAALSEEDLSELEAALERHRSESEAARRRHEEVERQRAGRTFDGAAYERKRQASSALAVELGEVQTARGRADRDLQDLEERFEKAGELRGRLKAAQDRFDTYRALSLDLRGDRFQEFLMARIQARLARRASHIVRTVTEGRYDLHLVDGEFYVKDAWNTGEARSARTLSGGETFIASLSLALALSDTLAGSRTLGALFLDEGFGTLDGLTLDAVASVLENLTREGRMVGVITHVEALTERMPARLMVAKGPEGSTVRWDL